MASLSDLQQITQWWASLVAPDFVPLPPPTRSRFTQGHLHEDASEVSGGRAYAGWHWQSHERSFDTQGTLIAPLWVHWGGSRQVVAERLAAVPEGWQLSGGESDEQAFSLDRVAALGADGAPDPGDATAVRQLLQRLAEPLDRSTPLFTYPTPTAAEVRWLHRALALRSDLDSAAPIVAALASRDLLAPSATEHWLPRWLALPELADWSAQEAMTGHLLRRDHPAVDMVLDRLGPAALEVLGEAAGVRHLPRLRTLTLADPTTSLRPLMTALVRVTGEEPNAVAAQLYAELGGDDAPMSEVRRLHNALEQVHSDVSHAHPPYLHGAGALIATDEAHLPLRLRLLSARTAENWNDRLLERSAGRTDAYGRAAHAAALRWPVVREELLPHSGPDLATTESRLNRVLGEFEHLDSLQEGWLHTQLADPSLGVRGVGLCLEVLYAHGRINHADLDALAPRWRSDLAKNHRMTYADWRHPLVTLTLAAVALEHPLAGPLTTWWGRARDGRAPQWAQELYPFTLTGADSVAEIRAAAEALQRVSLWTHLLLVRAAAEGRMPTEIGAEEWQAAPTSPPRARRQLADATIAVAQPGFPRWLDTPSPDTRLWLECALRVAEDTSLPDGLRTHAARLAARHRIITAPKSGESMNDEVRAALLARVERL